PVPRADLRLKEADRLGFRSSVAPAATPADACPRGFDIIGVAALADLVANIAAGSVGEDGERREVRRAFPAERERGGNGRQRAQ
ncbi:hypothetical protein J8J40_31340, partial [Mycobacterium tuberculosis]|nr:hypothetical protein [Mycobacterium tuberculosis]